MNNLKKIISVIILIILFPILFVNVVILINSMVNPNEIPSFFGWKPFIVLSGSMESEIKAGDLVIVKEVSEGIIKEDDIIAFKKDDFVVTHRVIEIIEDNSGIKKYITRGDNNNTKDSGYVVEEEIEGLYQFRIEGLGNLAMFIQTPTGMLVSLSIPLGLLILVNMMDSKKIRQEQLRKNKDMEEELEKLRKQNEDLKKK